jgi:hypothetical protein
VNVNGSGPAMQEKKTALSRSMALFFYRLWAAHGLVTVLR